MPKKAKKQTRKSKKTPFTLVMKGDGVDVNIKLANATNIGQSIAEAFSKVKNDLDAEAPDGPPFIDNDSDEEWQYVLRGFREQCAVTRESRLDDLAQLIAAEQVRRTSAKQPTSEATAS